MIKKWFWYSTTSFRVNVIEGEKQNAYTIILYYVHLLGLFVIIGENPYRWKLQQKQIQVLATKRPRNCSPMTFYQDTSLLVPHSSCTWSILTVTVKASYKEIGARHILKPAFMSQVASETTKTYVLLGTFREAWVRKRKRNSAHLCRMLNY